jgi:glycosyltransferase involved in cell wall biosynthesis
MLSRLHPTKGLDLLIEAWRRVAPAFPGWHLLIAGPPGGAYQAAMERQAARLGLLASLTFCGPLYERDKDAALRHAAVLVLPSRSENFGLSAAEALACGVPVITTRGTPWAGVVGARDPAVPEPFPDGIAAGRCGWWVEASADGLAGALREAMGLDAATRRAMGAEGQRWVRHALDVQRIAVRMRLVYEACLPGPPPRACPARLPS